ncbi:hypothetical protein [Streptomyces buecherae]|uniref:Uncharacterized protein n=1 Tax=Streptomyces buecherae TaxID=2763006 RepID=A0A7H8N6F8_9ACTN|nr:hypothetical protein [Streptomyces buecherae]QKW50094.1 hypothetical protein HUT08_11695 [Streptomyces buecherae]
MTDADPSQTNGPTGSPRRPPRPWHHRVPPEIPTTVLPPRNPTLAPAYLATAVWVTPLAVLFSVGVASASDDRAALAGSLFARLTWSAWLTGLVTWRLTRRKVRPYWRLVLIALPVYAVAFAFVLVLVLLLVDNVLANLSGA